MIRLKHRGDPGAIPVPWVYFHGDIEDVVASRRATDGAPDLVGLFTGNYERPEGVATRDGMIELPIGSYKVDVYGHEASAFVWTAQDRGEETIPRGLIVLSSDERSRQYAEGRMFERARFL